MHETEPNILLVEDDENDRVFIKRALQRNGITAVATVNNGEEAIAYLRSTQAAPNSVPPPTLIITDLKMPKMDGIDLLAWLHQQENLGNIPAVVLTSSSDHSDIDAAFQHGAKGYMIKPVQFGDLDKVMRTTVDYWRASCFPLVSRKHVMP
ncbi:MAG: hypothetical protein RIQ93_1893 [Verrucomicrobiota bacterium]|jgi:CheY-like chemotaxis protein